MRLRLEHGRGDDLKTLQPAYFALVMATGIVSIATYLHGIPVLPKALFWLNTLFLAGLVVATGARASCDTLVRSPPTSKAIATVWASSLRSRPRPFSAPSSCCLWMPPGLQPCFGLLLLRSGS